jgi:hypothetical protein
MILLGQGEYSIKGIPCPSHLTEMTLEICW